MWDNNLDHVNVSIKFYNMKSKFKVEFVQGIEEFSNKEMSNVIGDKRGNSRPCNCHSFINFKSYTRDKGTTISDGGGN